MLQGCTGFEFGREAQYILDMWQREQVSFASTRGSFFARALAGHRNIPMAEVRPGRACE